MMRKYRKPYQVKRKKSIFKNRFFWLVILILLIFGGIFYLIFFHSFFQIKEVKISGNQKVPAESLENLIKEKISQKVLFFSRKSIFLVNLNEINQNILEKFPQLSQVNLSKKFPNAILVQVGERKPVVIFCQDTSCFSVDKEGIVFESAETKQDFIRLKKEIDREINLGEKIISQEELSKILETESKLKNELKILLEEILIVSEERFNVKTSESWQIYFNFKGDLLWQLTKLKAVLEKEVPQEKRKNLEYIDLRFGNFAPYKYR